MNSAQKSIFGSFATFRPLVVSFLLFATALSTQAQVFHGGLNFLVGLPQGALKENGDRAGVGLTGNIGLAPRDYAFMIGLQFGYMNYGTEKKREPFSITIPDVTVDVATENNLAPGHLFLRLQQNSGFFRPYLEEAVGGNYLFTKTTLQNQGNGGEEVASSTNLDDFAFSYGGGGGVLISIYTKNDAEPEGGQTGVGRNSS
ncbi:MAG: hypothetical protein NTU47_01850 [Ignavibacteriales bacterium]|nr:hypothetical protein [Ignavibacteriales bacterium]